MNEPPFRTIKGHIAGGIASGRWGVGDILPSENALCRTFQVSRMTVNRAMRELANENLIRRVPGVGTFVAEPAAQSGLVEIRSIAQEIFARGHRHSAQVLNLETIEAPDDVALLFDMLPGARLFHSMILHMEEDIPLQLEDRFVSPEIAPGYVQQDFTQTTPHEYLMRVAPLSQAEHLVQAIAAPDEIALLLSLAVGEPCLLVSRRTWVGAQPASRALLYHPGSRFRLGGRFGNHADLERETP